MMERHELPPTFDLTGIAEQIAMRHGIDPIWRSHLDVTKPRIGDRYPSVYEFTARNRRDRLDIVQVRQVATATTGRAYEWQLVVEGVVVGTYDRKTDAQRAAETIVGLS